MSIVITDVSLLQKLIHASGTLDFRDPQGNLIGTFAPPTVRPVLRSPYSEEEIERRRQEPDGRPLADILRDLEKGA